ncbi:MAG: hypothetical protein H7174_03195 [Flavobacterium sp.]|nr:hypothetical protein [Flavobacterium sp.]
MIKKLHCFLLFLFLANASINAQKNSNRLEFDIKDGYENEVTFPMGANGIIQEATASDANDGQVEIKSDLYSTDLVLKKSFSILIKSRCKIDDYCDSEGVHYSVYRGSRDYFAIVMLNTINMTYTKIEGEYDNDDTFNGMKVINNIAVFKTLHNGKSTIVIIDLKTGETKVSTFKFEHFSSSDLTIEDFQVYNDEILVFINAKTNRKNEDLYISKLNFNGDQLETYNITTDIEEKLITFQATKMNGKYILTGTFSKTKKDMSQGIFLAEVVNKKLNFMKFYNFLDLKNFTSYLPQKQQDKIEKKKERKEENGKELLINYNIAIHPIIAVENGYEFLGEAYYPVYHTVTTRMANGGFSSYTVFDGYRYTHAVLAKFDKQGGLSWDNTFSMYPNSMPFYVKRFIQIKQDNANLNLVFADRNQINYKSFNPLNGSEIKSTTQEIIDTYNEGDKVKRSFSNIEYWYDDNFLAFGSQVIINKEAEKRKRKIIFLNKIAIESKNKN